MGCQGCWGYLLKPQSFLTTLVGLATLVYGIYLFEMPKQASLDSGPLAMIQLGRPLIKAISLSNSFFDNLPKACTDLLSLYVGSSVPDFGHKHDNKGGGNKPISSSIMLDQHEAPMFYFRSRVTAAPEGSLERKQAQKELDDVVLHRNHIDCAIKEIGKALFGEENYYEMITTIRSPVVDDWDCYKTLRVIYMRYCGKLEYYGGKYMQAFANMCNAGLRQHQLAEAASQVCNSKCTFDLFSEAYSN